MIHMFIEDKLEGKFYICIDYQLSKSNKNALIFHSVEQAERCSFDIEESFRLELDSIRFEDIETGEEIERATFNS